MPRSRSAVAPLVAALSLCAWTLACELTEVEPDAQDAATDGATDSSSPDAGTDLSGTDLGGTDLGADDPGADDTGPEDAVDEDACASDADCRGGFRCVVPAPSADGTADDGTCNTTCNSNADCATGFDCDVVDATCVASTTPPPPDCTTDAQCAGAYACDADGGACFDTCTTGEQCKDDAQCTDNVCERTLTTPFVYVAVLSEVLATSRDVSGTTTPGPDLDAIQLINERSTLEADTVTAYVAGAVGDRGNTAVNPNEVLGVRDAMTGDGPLHDCNVNAGYLSLGASDGFVVVSFSGNAEIRDGAQITVWEIADQDCAQDIPPRDDAYSVYIGQDGVPAPTTAADLRGGSGWCTLGSMVGGGIGTFTVTLANCD